MVGKDSLEILRTRLKSFNPVMIDVQHLTLHTELSNAGVGIPYGRDLRNKVDCTGVKLYLVGAIR